MKGEFVFKIIIVGDTNVGKTQILNSFTNKFEEKIVQLLELISKLVKLKTKLKNSV